MTQEEKLQLQAAQKLYKTANADQKYVLETLFPELRKSEDERIRKVLVELVKCNERCGYFMINNITTSAMLAWLEKQQGEQNPTDNDMIEALRTEYEKGRADAIAEMQKELSEDDEEEFQIAIDTLVEAGQRDSAHWLKSIKDRIQPKVELTQVDKIILEAAIAFVEHNNHFNCWRGVDKHTVLSALHSLRPQNTWKPSDGQMNILFKYAEQNNKDGSILTSLYQDLKKLREE